MLFRLADKKEILIVIVLYLKQQYKNYYFNEWNIFRRILNRLRTQIKYGDNVKLLIILGCFTFVVWFILCLSNYNSNKKQFNFVTTLQLHEKFTLNYY